MARLRKTPNEIKIIRLIRQAERNGATHLIPFYQQKLVEERALRLITDKRYK
jgi:5-formyltetrahydrofolate cyclo-ligase